MPGTVRSNGPLPVVKRQASSVKRRGWMVIGLVEGCDSCQHSPPRGRWGGGGELVAVRTHAAVQGIASISAFGKEKPGFN